MKKKLGLIGKMGSKCELYLFAIAKPQKVMIIMETPCQKIVWDLVPAIRASLAIELVNKGQSQAASAKLLGIAPSAVSQYISGKRGYRIEFQGETKELIEKLAQDLIDKKVDDFVPRICRICTSARGIEGSCSSTCVTEEPAAKEKKQK
ncbi:transcriptional regulator [Methanosarcina siciliae]|nr:transcriptional regulator [Methanosarcina siciliae]